MQSSTRKFFDPMLGRVQKVSVSGERNDDSPSRNRPLLNEDERRDVTDQMLLAAAEVDYQEDIIRQREAGINSIQRDVHRIHDLFQDVAVHVSDQGQILDHIEANVSSAAERTREANDQLNVANRRRGTTRQNMLCLLLISLLILVLLAMIKALFHPNFSLTFSEEISRYINSNVVRTFQS